MLEPDRDGEKRATLAEALRELRRAAGLSGERLAVRCAMSQAKISRIETGRILPTVIDVEQILRALEVPEEVAEEILALTRAANVDYTSWRTYARIGLWRRQVEIQSLTSAAKEVRQFLPAIPSGLLQTRDYARYAFMSAVAGRPAGDVEKMVDARLAGQSVLDDPHRKFSFLMTEQAVRWRRAPVEVMAEQVAHLMGLSARPNIDISILPVDVDVFAAPLNIFVIYDERLVKVELFSGSVVLRDPRDVAYHREVFDFFLSRALRGADAVEFLQSVKEEFQGEIDGGALEC